MALTPDLATFRLIYPEFATVPDATVEFWLETAEAELSEGAWGTCWPRAVLSYAAHNVALGEARKANSSAGADGTVEQEPSGAVVSASGEGLSVTFAQASNLNKSDIWWNQTPYGQAYLVAQRTCLGRGGLSW